MSKNVQPLIFGIIFMLLFSGFASHAHAKENKEFNLTPEVSIKLILLDKLRSGDCRKNERVNYKVDEDVCDKNGTVLIKRGSPAYGTVLNSRRNGMWGKRGALDVSIEYTTAADGQRVSLRSTKEKRGGGSKSLMTAGAILVAWPLAFCKGSNVTIDAGTTFVAYVDDNLFIETSAKSDLPEARPGVAGPAPVVSEKLLVLQNGDRISGQIIELRAGLYSVKTNMGVLSVKEADVKTIETLVNSAPPLKVISPEPKESELEKRLKTLKGKNQK